MQKLFAALEKNLAGFVTQRDSFAMLVQCREEEVPAITKTLESLDEASTSELYWHVPDDFTNAAFYVESVVQAFRVKFGAVRMAMAKEGRQPWPELPAPVLDYTRSPVDRLRDLLVFSRELPPVAGAVTVWAFLPARIVDPGAWAAFLGELLQHSMPRPWCSRLRLFVRGDRDDPAALPLRTMVAPIPHVVWYQPDVGMDAILRAVDQAVDDPTLPMEARAQNAFISASLDSAHGRIADALQKFSVLLKYYGGVKNGTMTSLLLATIGDLYNRAGDSLRGNRLLELSISTASLSPQLPIPVLLQSTSKLAHHHLATGDYALAEGFFDGLRRLAILQRAPDVLVRAWDGVAYCQYVQGRVPEALQSWGEGVKLAEGTGLEEGRQQMLQRLRWFYEQTGDAQAVGMIDARMATPLPPPELPPGPEPATPASAAELSARAAAN